MDGKAEQEAGNAKMRRLPFQGVRRTCAWVILTIGGSGCGVRSATDDRSAMNFGRAERARVVGVYAGTTDGMDVSLALDEARFEIRYRSRDEIEDAPYGVGTWSVRDGRVELRYSRRNGRSLPATGHMSITSEGLEFLVEWEGLEVGRPTDLGTVVLKRELRR